MKKHTLKLLYRETKVEMPIDYLKKVLTTRPTYDLNLNFKRTDDH